MILYIENIRNCYNKDIVLDKIIIYKFMKRWKFRDEGADIFLDYLSETMKKVCKLKHL